jgi:hypothetical protein
VVPQQEVLLLEVLQQVGRWFFCWWCRLFSRWFLSRRFLSRRFLTEQEVLSKVVRQEAPLLV